MSLDRLRHKKANHAATVEEASPTKRVTSLAAPSALARLEKRKHVKAAITPAEIDRICSLPIEPDMTAEEHTQFCRDSMMADAFVAGRRLFPTQSAAFRTYDKCGGLFGPIGVGWGKSMISLGIAQRGFDKGLRKILLCVPPQVYGQLVGQDISFCRRMIPINVPFHLLGGKGLTARRALYKSQRTGCYILPYSMLSTRDTHEMLEEIRPQLCIFDEAHNLKNRKAARTRRVVEMLQELLPEVVALSGTITSKSVMDYWHLLKAALRDGCPLPLTGHMAADWALVLDSTAAPSRNQSGPILPLVHWARENFPSEELPIGVPGFRKAYQLRLTSTAGVVSTGDQEIKTSLTLSKYDHKDYRECTGGEKLDKLLRQLKDEWKTPDGDEIEHAIHMFKWEYELTAGFYNSLKWPTVERVAKLAAISESEAQGRLDRALELHAERQAYHSLLRKWLQRRARPGLDTPMLVGNSMHRHQASEVGQDLFDQWSIVKRMEDPRLPERYREPIRVCPFKIEAAVEWALDLKGGGIIWVHNKEMGAWCAEALGQSGVDYLHCPAGGMNNERIIDHANKGKIIVASISAHGTGKNLQHFQNQLFLQWPRGAREAEQVLGRTHRNGQKADELYAHVLRDLEFDQMTFAATLVDACYIHQTTATRQKLMYAGYDPLPQIHNPAVLRQMGFENKMLNKEQAGLLQDKFGVWAEGR